MDLGEKMKENAEAFPEKAAIIFRDEVTTYVDLNDRAARFGNALTSLGLRPRDKVAVILRNSTEYLEIIHGLCKAGLVHVPVNWRFAPEEMRHVIKNSESGVVVVSEEYAEKLAPVKDDLESLVKGRYILIGEKAPWNKCSLCSTGTRNRLGSKWIKSTCQGRAALYSQYCALL